MRIHVFADEAGNFDFSQQNGASRFYILTTVIMESCEAADSLIQLRRDLVWEGLPVGDAFHATTDKQDVRDRVFDTIAAMDIRVDATVFEKRKTVPHRQEQVAFYKLAWYQHATHVIRSAVPPNRNLHVIAASLGTKKYRSKFAEAIEDVVDQCGRTDHSTRVSHWRADTDPCLQVADYCCWAIQRKWERQDERSHLLIKHLIHSEYDMWKYGSTYYY